MDEVYRLTYKEFAPGLNYFTYLHRQRPRKERNAQEKTGIKTMIVGLTLYNAIVLIPTFAIISNLEKLVE